MTTPTDPAEIKLTESLEALLAAIRALGSETARDMLDDHLATMAEDQDTEHFEAVLVELLSEAIRTAAEVADEDVQHCITLRSFTDGSSVQFAWGGDAGAPMSDTFTDAVLSAVKQALGLRRAQVH